EPVNARRGAALYQLRKFAYRHRFAVAVSGVAFVALCAALVFAFTQARVAKDERDRAFALVTRNQAVTQFLGTVITEAAESEKPVTVRDMLAQSEKLALGETDGDRENRASVLFMLANYYQTAGDAERSLHLVDNALTVLGDSPDADLRGQMICGRSIVQALMG